MRTSPSSSLLDALRDLRGVLDDLRRPAMIIGGLAVVARGVPRHTIDVDATIEADGLDLHGRSVDMPRIRPLLAELLEAIKEPERMADFDRLVATVLRRG